MEATAKKTTWEVPSGIVKIKLINKSVNPLITDPEHEAYNLFGTSTRDYLIPMDQQGNLHNPFECKEEQEWLEKALDVDLNWHKSTENYWFTAKLSLGKSDYIIDKSNPKQYLDYIIARTNKMYVAPSLKLMKKKATYKYVIVAQDEEMKVSATKVNKHKEAYKFFGKIEDDKEQMLNFLKVYGNKVSAASKESFLVTEIGKILEEDIDGFLAVARDKDTYEIRLLIAEAVEAGAVTKERRKYFLPGGDPLCGEGDSPTMENAILYLKNKANQDVLLTIRARIKNTK